MIYHTWHLAGDDAATCRVCGVMFGTVANRSGEGSNVVV